MIPIDSALFYLHEKVKNDKNSSENEIEAINTLVSWINDSKKEYLEKNKMFSKLYIIYFGILIEHYKDIEFAQKSIHKDLSENIGFHAYELRNKINNIEFFKFCKSIGLSDKNYNFMSKEEIKDRDLIISKNESEYLKNINKWDQESINSALNNQISEAINRFKHYD